MNEILIGAKDKEDLILHLKDFVEEEYAIYTDWFGEEIFVLSVTNNSNETVSLQGNLIAYSADDMAVGADSAYLDVLGPGEKAIMEFDVLSKTPISYGVYDIVYREETYYNSAISDLTYEASINSENVVLTVK